MDFALAAVTSSIRNKLCARSVVTITQRQLAVMQRVSFPSQSTPDFYELLSDVDRRAEAIASFLSSAPSFSEISPRLAARINYALSDQLNVIGNSFESATQLVFLKDVDLKGLVSDRLSKSVDKLEEVSRLLSVRANAEREYMLIEEQRRKQTIETQKKGSISRALSCLPRTLHQRIDLLRAPRPVSTRLEARVLKLTNMPEHSSTAHRISARARILKDNFHKIQVMEPQVLPDYVRDIIKLMIATIDDPCLLSDGARARVGLNRAIEVSDEVYCCVKRIRHDPSLSVEQRTTLLMHVSGIVREEMKRMQSVERHSVYVHATTKIATGRLGEVLSQCSAPVK